MSEKTENQRPKAPRDLEGKWIPAFVAEERERLIAAGLSPRQTELEVVRKLRSEVRQMVAVYEPYAGELVAGLKLYLQTLDENEQSIKDEIVREDAKAEREEEREREEKRLAQTERQARRAYTLALIGAVGGALSFAYQVLKLIFEHFSSGGPTPHP